MPAIRRLSDAPYRWDIVEAPLSEVANREKHCPPSSSALTASASPRRHAAIWRRLSLAKLIRHTRNGLPDYVKLQNAAVPKKLAAEFAV